MADNLDNFGAGVFDDPPAEENSVDQPVVLTEREEAIARGDDPDQPAEELQDDVSEAVSEDSPEESSQQLEDPVEEPVEETQPVDAFSLGDRKLAARYGMSEEDIQKFGSPEALHHALDMLDRTGAKSESSEDSEDSTESPASGLVEDAAADSGGGALSEILGFEKLDVSRYENSEDPFDEDTLTLVKHVRKTEDLLEKLTGMIVQTETSKNAEIFHDTLDEYPELYGVSLKDGVAQKLDSGYEEARQAVRDQAEVIYAGIVARKGDVPPVNQIIEQAIMAVHGKQLGSSSSKPDKSEKLKRQSSKRRSPGSTAASSRRQAADIDPTSAGSIAKHPEIEALWRKAQEANGAV